MREHYLSNPKTPKSRRAVSVSIAAILEKLIVGKAANDFGPIHNADFYPACGSR